MRKWDRFIKNKDENHEKEILRNLTLEKKIISELEQVFKYDVGVQLIEPKQEKVSFGALSRCCTCLESIILLIRNGYVGSANALLRQVYELLVWAKMAIDTDDNDILIKMHDDFFKNSVTAEGDTLTPYFSRIDFTFKDKSLDKGMVLQEGKLVFKTYSCSLHGNSLAQQKPYRDDDFYDGMIALTRETALWTACLSEVLISFLRKCAYCLREDGDESAYDNRIPTIGCLMEMVSKQQYRLQSILPNYEHVIMYRIFKGTEWKVI